MMKQNCWEYHKCGREPGGAKVNDYGVCPAATDSRLDGVHGGQCSGRTCWVISGTYCNGEVQGEFAKKFGECMNCDFYKLVKSEEYPNFTLSAVLLKQLTDMEAMS